MLKRLFAILSVVLGTIMFLSGCSKDNHNTLAFIGDESEMKSCYEIYPQQYFPSEISDLLREGRFPPDIVGEYEMIGSFVNGYYERYNQSTQQYVPFLPGMYPAYKTIHFIIEDQVNGIGKIRFRYKSNNGNYQPWHESDAFIYGNVFSENNNRDFLVCFDDVQEAGEIVYYRGNIIKGTISEAGIVNIEIYRVIKEIKFKTTIPPQTNNVGNYDHYHADLAERK